MLKKILIILILTLSITLLYSAESEDSREYNMWKNIYWATYFTTIGFTATYSILNHVPYLISNSVTGSLTSEELQYALLYFTLDLFVMGSLVAIPIVGSYIYASTSLVAGVVQLVIYSLKINGARNVNATTTPEYDLRLGIFGIINACIFLPSAIIQHVAKKKMKKIKERMTKNNMSFNFSLNFLGSKKIEFCMGMRF